MKLFMKLLWNYFDQTFSNSYKYSYEYFPYKIFKIFNKNKN